jgi:chemotaxis protein methyltransferase WspC
MTALAAIAELLRDRIGFDADTVGARSLAHAVRGRVRARQLDGAAAYLASLADDPVEWEALLEAVVVPETWFFRDREPFALLARWAARQWAGRADPVTVLSLPCASGEEAWSIAIALAAAGLPPQTFHIDAIDLSERALATARAGLYAARALRGQRLHPAWSGYLRACPDGRLAVADELRGSVHFARGNLVDARRALAGRRYDCVFSRNLLIYCDAATRTTALATFAALLRCEGLLVLGHAETVPARTPGFVRAGPAGAFAWRRTDAPDTRRPAGARTPRPHVSPAAPRQTGSRARSLPPLRGKVRTGGELAQARQLADRGELSQAAARATTCVERTPGDAAAHALLGIVRAAQGRDREAAEHLRRALYLEPAREEALVHLALVLERRGDAAAAARLRQRARRAEGAR